MSKEVKKVVEPIKYSVVRIARPKTSDDFKWVRLELKKGNVVTIGKASKLMNKNADMISGLDLPKVKLKWEVGEPDAHEGMPHGVKVLQIRGIAFEVVK